MLSCEHTKKPLLLRPTRHRGPISGRISSSASSCRISQSLPSNKRRQTCGISFPTSASSAPTKSPSRVRPVCRMEGFSHHASGSTALRASKCTTLVTRDRADHCDPTEIPQIFIRFFRKETLDKRNSERRHLHNVSWINGMRCITHKHVVSRLMKSGEFLSDKSWGRRPHSVTTPGTTQFP